MTVVVFCGPTLSHARLREILPDADPRGPAAQGDVYDAALDGPEAIAIVDGYFASVPSVWHKEILWALDRGISVFGASSMGALRAAELADFGMVGIGRIFRDYRDGRLHDDDEVAVIHGPAELGYPALSEAMVNLRATLASLARLGLVTDKERDALIDCLKRRHFSRRSLAAALADFPEISERIGGPDALGRHYVDLKLRDAEELLQHLAAHPAPETVAVPFHFEETHHWATLTAAVHQRRDALAASSLGMDRQGASRLVGLLATHLAAYQGVTLNAVQRQRAAERFCRTFGLETPGQVDSWLQGKALKLTDLRRLIDELALVGLYRDAFADMLPNEVALWDLLEPDA